MADVQASLDSERGTATGCTATGAAVDRPHSALFTPEKREPRPRGIRALGPGLGLVRPAAEWKLYVLVE